MRQLNGGVAGLDQLDGLQAIGDVARGNLDKWPTECIGTCPRERALRSPTRLRYWRIEFGATAWLTRRDKDLPAAQQGCGSENTRR
jgi:hypothetical protein